MQDFLILTISIFGPPLLGYGIRKIYRGVNKKEPPPSASWGSSFDVTQKDFGDKKESPYSEN